MTEENFNENNEDDMIDVEVTELVLDNEEINELIAKLQELKQTKKHIEFEIDEENDLLIHHEDEETGSLKNRQAVLEGEEE